MKTELGSADSGEDELAATSCVGSSEDETEPTVNDDDEAQI